MLREVALTSDLSSKVFIIDRSTTGYVAAYKATPVSILVPWRNKVLYHWGYRHQIKSAKCHQSN